MVVSWRSRSCVPCWGGAVGWQRRQWPATSTVGGGGWGSDERKKEKKTHLNEVGSHMGLWARGAVVTAGVGTGAFVWRGTGGGCCRWRWGPRADVWQSGSSSDVAEAELVVSRGLACRDGMLGGKDFRMAGWWWLKLAWGKRWRWGKAAATMTWLCDSGERYHVTTAASPLRHTSAHGPRLHLQHPPPVPRHAKAPVPMPAITTAPLYVIREAHHHANSLPTSPRDYPPHSSHCRRRQPTAPPQHGTQDLDRQPTTMPPQHGTPRLGCRARPCRPTTPFNVTCKAPATTDPHATSTWHATPRYPQTQCHAKTQPPPTCHVAPTQRAGPR
ncbi:hypothetical protein EDB89DRAFT_1901140 [Lactarius sanguifluus]|nr:hypothetical protein EDB89DRAFT_1901140 [Lactarius sanguifluus]